MVPKRGPTDRRYESSTFEANEQGGFHKLTVASQKKRSSQNRNAMMGPIFVAVLILGYLYWPKI